LKHLKRWNNLNYLAEFLLGILFEWKFKYLKKIKRFFVINDAIFEQFRFGGFFKGFFDEAFSVF
jgi:hypothetical protein